MSWIGYVVTIIPRNYKQNRTINKITTYLATASLRHFVEIIPAWSGDWFCRLWLVNQTLNQNHFKPTTSTNGFSKQRSRHWKNAKHNMYLHYPVIFSSKNTSRFFHNGNKTTINAGDESVEGETQVLPPQKSDDKSNCYFFTWLQGFVNLFKICNKIEVSSDQKAIFANHVLLFTQNSLFSFLGWYLQPY